MISFFTSLFQPKDSKTSSDNSAEEEAVEKKKCKRCLRRINLDYSRCPFCGCMEFCDN